MAQVTPAACRTSTSTLDHEVEAGSAAFNSANILGREDGEPFITLIDFFYPVPAVHPQVRSIHAEPNISITKQTFTPTFQSPKSRQSITIKIAFYRFYHLFLGAYVAPCGGIDNFVNLAREHHSLGTLFADRVLFQNISIDWTIYHGGTPLEHKRRGPCMALHGPALDDSSLHGSTQRKLILFMFLILHVKHGGTNGQSQRH